MSHRTDLGGVEPDHSVLPAARTLMVLGLIGSILVFHVPTHLASVLGRLTRQVSWIDTVRLPVPGAATGFWLPSALLLAGLAWARRGSIPVVSIASTDRTDLVMALIIAAVATAIRLWTLLNVSWIKPDFDEGVYLGGAWLLHSGALPYRDFVFVHPPGSLIVLQPAAAMIRLWQNNEGALRAGRAIAAVSDGLAAGLVVLAARQLVGRPGAVLAGLVYASDALTIGYSRGVRLEPLQAPWLVAGGLFVLLTLKGHRSGFIAGLFLAMGVAIKMTGVVVPLGALLVFTYERRWLALRDCVLGLIVGAGLLTGWCILFSGNDILRQTVLLQLQRPPEAQVDRWGFLLGDRWTTLTALAASAGIVVLVQTAWRGAIASGWLFVLAWLTLTLALFAGAPSFYPHYYVGLVPPLVLLAGLLPAGWRLHRPRWAFVGSAVLLCSAFWGQARIWSQVDRAATLQLYAADLQTLPPDHPTLTFVPVLSVLAGRPLLRPTHGPYLLDTFLGEPYLNSPLNHRWPDAQAVRSAALATADYILGTRVETGNFPDIEKHFVWRKAQGPGDVLLWRKVDHPSEIVAVGDRLELLALEQARVETAGGGQRLMVPLHWRAAATPPADDALSLRLKNPAGIVVAQVDVSLNGGTSWNPRGITTLEYAMPLGPRLRCVGCTIELVAYRWSDGATLPFKPSGGTARSSWQLPDLVNAHALQ